MDYDPTQPCLSLTMERIEPRPHPSFSGGKAWDCPRCGKTFSEPMPTYWDGNEACRTYRKARDRAGLSCV